MALPRKSSPGDSLSVVAKRLDSLIDHVASALRISISPEMTLSQSASGIRLGLKPQQQQPASVIKPSDSGIPIEIHEAWDSEAIYRIGERCVHKPDGAIYPYVYEANAVPESTDIPGTSSKWTKITDNQAIWSAEATYSVGNKVMFGAPWQMYVYTANTATSAGEAPVASAKWTKGDGVVFGTSALPVYDPDSPLTVVPVPAKEVYGYREYYNPTTHQMICHVRTKTYDATGMFLKLDGYTKQITAQLVPHPGS